MNTGWSPEAAARASLSQTQRPVAAPKPRPVAPTRQMQERGDAPRRHEGQSLTEWIDAVERWANDATTRAVIAAGDTEHPDLLVVGKAPGPEEARNGRAFSGRSGEELRRMLKALDRDIRPNGKVIATNASVWTLRSGESPDATALARTRPVLETFVRIETLRAILALGAEAATALTGIERSVSKSMGRWHRCRLVPDGPLIRVIYHPAYLLRSPQEAHRVRPELTEVRAKLQAQG